MDHEIIKKLLAALTQLDALKPQSPLDQCIDEQELWAFIDSDHIEEKSPEFSHLENCASCLQRLAKALQNDTDKTLSNEETSFLDSKNSKILLQKDIKSRPMHLHMDQHIAPSHIRPTTTATDQKKAGGAKSDQHTYYGRYIDIELAYVCVTLTSTNLKIVEGLRHDSSQGIYLTETVADLRIQVEIMKSEKHDTFELFVEISAIKNAGKVSVELWDSATMKRSIAIDFSKKQNLSRWPKGSYKIIVKSAGNFEHPILLNVR
jgi:hypothetical protein